MKSKQCMAVSIMMLLPMSMQAQENIKRTFDALINSSQATVSTTHKLNKDPETGKKEGQLDVYEFTLPQSSVSLIKDIERAFDKDKDHAYSLNTATAGKKEYNYESLAIGGSKTGYQLGDIRGSSYIYALFLDPEDESKTHRYAYAMEWREGSKEIEGKLVITYATTQKYREGRRMSRTITVNGNNIKLKGSGISFGEDIPLESSFSIGNDSVFVNHNVTSESWLSSFNSFRNLFLKNPNSTAASYYVTQIYKMCKQAACLEDVEKNIVCTEILKLKRATKDEFLQQMFDMSIERLKK